MSTYSIALFGHFVSLLLAVVCTALTGYAALRVCAAGTADDAKQWLALNGRLVRLFPAAGVGLIATGAYMAHSISGWSEPWLLTSVFGLACIIVLHAAVDGSRSRALGRELHIHGLSDRARALARDPVAWTAKLTGPMVMLAVMFVMTTKPQAATGAAALIVAVIVGILGARPFWHAPSMAGAPHATQN